MAQAKNQPVTYTRLLISSCSSSIHKGKNAVPKIAKLMKRSEGSLRQKALRLGIGLGHQR